MNGSERFPVVPNHLLAVGGSRPIEGGTATTGTARQVERLPVSQEA
jgi:hypothetical protein